MFKKEKHHYHKKRRHISHFFKYSKDGVITGSADNDPSGIVTYTQVGAATGFAQLWLLLLTLPMLTVVEEISARIGVVTKKGLSHVICDQFGHRIGVLAAVIVMIANTVTIGADIAAMAAVGEILSGVSSVILILVLVLGLAYFILKESYQSISRFLLLLTPVFLLYVGAAILANPDWLAVLRATLIPSFGGMEYFTLAVALFGTTISPYLLYWQTTEEVEDHKTIADIKEESKGVFFGMAYSHLIFYFVVIAAGAVFFSQGAVIETAEQAALSLKPFVGELAFLFFSIGILGSGLLAVPVLSATTGYVISEAFHLNEGFNKPFKKAHGFYGVIIVSLLIGMGIALCGINPIKMLVYSQVLNGLLMPFLLIFLMIVSNKTEIMGKHTNSLIANIVGWATVAVMIVFDALMIAEWIL